MSGLQPPKFTRYVAGDAGRGVSQSTRSAIADNRRVYSEEEFALILHKAAELANSSDHLRDSPGGLTLTELKAAAAEAGFDPDLVERAARLLPARGFISPSVLERLIGGELRHRYEAHFPTILDESSAAELLSAVQFAVGDFGGTTDGQSGATSMTWHSSSGFEAFGIAARSDKDGTEVVVTLDRGRALIEVGALTVFVSFLAGLFGVFAIGPESTPALGAAASLSGIGAVLAIARGYWTSSTARARERIERAMDSAGRSLIAISAVRDSGEQATSAGAEAQLPGDTS